MEINSAFSVKKSSSLVISLSIGGAMIVAAAIGVFVWLGYRKNIADE